MDRKGSQSSQKNSHRYGASLLLGVLVIFGSRLPSQLWAVLEAKKDFADLYTLLFYTLANIPLFLCSCLNPWMYAYHNLDLKPVMKRLLKKACKGLIKPNERASNEDPRENQSYFTNWQISVFATFPGRRSSWHQTNSQNQPQNITTPNSSRPTSAASFNRSKSHISYRHKRRKSLATAFTTKTRRSKSCTHRTIPTVTVWDGDSVRLSGQDQML